MPELPEVETIARGLSRILAGRRIEQVHLSRADVVHGTPFPLCAALRGRRIEQVDRSGKQVRLRLETRPDDPGATFVYVHLGMSGRLIAVDRDAEVEPHTHLRVTFHRCRRELRYIDPRRFGGVWLMVENVGINGDGIGRRQPTIGLDPLAVTRERFRELMRCRRQIKPMLLAQAPISGIGNIYCDEVLHRAGVHPLTRACDLDREEVDRLRRNLRRVLREAIAAGGSSIRDYRAADNAPGAFQERHRVYQRAGRPCRACGSEIRRLTVAGRSTFFCETCQPR